MVTTRRRQQFKRPSFSLFLTPIEDNNGPPPSLESSDNDGIIAEDVDDIGSTSSATEEAEASSTYGVNVVGGQSVGTGMPFQTDGGVIMPEGGANPCVIKVREPFILFYFVCVSVAIIEQGFDG